MTFPNTVQNRTRFVKREELLSKLIERTLGGEDLQEWHEKLGHQNIRQCEKVLKSYGKSCAENLQAVLKKVLNAIQDAVQKTEGA